jgi:hypothetical protein
MLRSRNRALAVYGLQVLVAIIAAPGDIAKLAGAEVRCVPAVRAGRVCSPCATAWKSSSPPLLLLRRGDAVGAMLLVALMLVTLGVTLGHVVSATAYSSKQGTFAPLLLARALALRTSVTCRRSVRGGCSATAKVQRYDMSTICGEFNLSDGHSCGTPITLRLER